MSNVVSKTISFLTNPMFVSAYVFTYVISLHEGLNGLLKIVIAILTTCILPIGYIIMLKLKGLVTDFYVSRREDRFKPFLVGLIGYTINLVSLVLLKAHIKVQLLALCYVVNTLFSMLITFKWKISVHLAGIAGPLTYLVLVYGASPLILIIAVIIVSWARIADGAHTLSQTVAGGLSAFILTYFQVILFKHFNLI